MGYGERTRDNKAHLFPTQGCDDVKRLSFLVAPMTQPWTVAAIIAHYSTRLQELDLSLCCGGQCAPLEPEILHALGTLHAMRVLRVRGCIMTPVADLSRAVQDCPGLRVLDVEGLHEPWGPQFVADVTQTLGHHLTELALPKRHSVMDDALLAEVGPSRLKKSQD